MNVDPEKQFLEMFPEYGSDFSKKIHRQNDYLKKNSHRMRSQKR